MLDKCANPRCKAEFKRLGPGRLYVFPISDPERWGLPKNSKQKVMWLCAECIRHKRILFDRQHAQAVVVDRPLQKSA